MPLGKIFVSTFKAKIIIYITVHLANITLAKNIAIITHYFEVLKRKIWLKNFLLRGHKLNIFIALFLN